MRFAVAAVAFTVFVLSSSSAMARKKPEPQIYAQLAHVPDEARARANPLEADPDAVVAGRKLYERHCAACHGSTAESGSKGPSLRAPEVQTASSGALFWVITNGNVRAGSVDQTGIPARTLPVVITQKSAPEEAV